MVVWEKFKALGSEAVIAVVAGEDAAEARRDIEAAKGKILDFGKRFSRFLADNELAALAAAQGRPRKVSGEMIALLETAKKFYAQTGGLFDPTIISALEKAGYDRSFELIEAENAPAEKIEASGPLPEFQKEFARRIKFDSLEINPGTSEILAPENFRIDLGGIGKGYLVDKISAELGQKHPNFWLSLGGDVFLSGFDQNGEEWKLGIQNPLALDKDLLFARTGGKKLAAATSGIVKRRGQKNGQKNGAEWHHLIDPRTGRPVQNDILAVTVFAGRAVEADVYAKTALVSGIKEGLAFTEKQENCEGVIIDKKMNLYFSSGARKYIYEKSG